MKESMRYKLDHIGDIIVEGIEKLWVSFRNTADGLVRQCAVCELSRKKQRLVKQIGERLTEIQAISPDKEIFRDETLSKLFKELDEIDNSIRERTPEHKEKSSGHATAEKFAE